MKAVLINEEKLPLSHICNKCGHVINSTLNVSYEIEEEESLKVYIDKGQVSCACPICKKENKHIIMATVNRSMVEIVQKLIKKGFVVVTSNSFGSFSKFIRNISVESEENDNNYITEAVEININYTNYLHNIDIDDIHFTEENLNYLKEKFNRFIESITHIRKVYDESSKEDFNLEKELYRYLVDYVFSHFDDVSFYYLFDKPNGKFSIICDEENAGEDREDREVYIFIENTDNNSKDQNAWIEWINNLPDLNDPNTMVDLCKKIDKLMFLPKDEYRELINKIYYSNKEGE